MSSATNEILSRAKAWEEANLGLAWMWSDVGAWPMTLVRLVADGKIEIVQKRKGRWPNFYRLIRE